jgi:hypothetical protein
MNWDEGISMNQPWGERFLYWLGCLLLAPGLLLCRWADTRAQRRRQRYVFRAARAVLRVERARQIRERNAEWLAHEEASAEERREPLVAKISIQHRRHSCQQ